MPRKKTWEGLNSSHKVIIFESLWEGHACFALTVAMLISGSSNNVVSAHAH